MSNEQPSMEPAIAPVTILLVDDSESDIRLTAEIMEESKLHNELYVARNGVEALSFLWCEPPHEEAPRPDLILLDLNMPRMDGRELLEKIRADEELTQIPIVVLTSSSAEEDIVESYQQHANCYVTKPLDLDQFAKIVQAIESFWFSVVRLPTKP